jgi:prevent-host-death family protein
MQIVSVHQAKTHLSRLIASVEGGEEVIIARGKTPVAKVVPLHPRSGGKRKLGWLRQDSQGSDPLAYGFWDPVAEVDLALWSGEVDYPDDATPA